MHATVCDHIAEVVQNSVEAGAEAVILDIREERDALEVYVSDQGRGMSPGRLKRALDPFANDAVKHPNRRVGLGLPFLAQACEQSGGRLEIDSEEGLGTSIHFRFDTTNLDAPPLGDLPATLTSLLSFARGCELQVNRARGEARYTLSRRELSDALGGMDDAEALALVKRYIDGQEETLRSEGLDS